MYHKQNECPYGDQQKKYNIELLILKYVPQAESPYGDHRKKNTDVDIENEENKTFNI